MTKKTYTLEELSHYHGQNGQPAYIAVKGKVYDLSEVFKEGEHYAHLAGKDLTEEFESQHLKEEIEKYSVVGKLKKENSYLENRQ